MISFTILALILQNFALTSTLPAHDSDKELSKEFNDNIYGYFEPHNIEALSTEKMKRSSKRSYDDMPFNNIVDDLQLTSYNNEVQGYQSNSFADSQGYMNPDQSKSKRSFIDDVSTSDVNLYDNYMTTLEAVKAPTLEYDHTSNEPKSNSNLYLNLLAPQKNFHFNTAPVYPQNGFGPRTFINPNQQLYAANTPSVPINSLMDANSFDNSLIPKTLTFQQAIQSNHFMTPFPTLQYPQVVKRTVPVRKIIIPSPRLLSDDGSVMQSIENLRYAFSTF